MSRKEMYVRYFFSEMEAIVKGSRMKTLGLEAGAAAPPYTLNNEPISLYLT